MNAEGVVSKETVLEETNTGEKRRDDVIALDENKINDILMELYSFYG